MQQRESFKRIAISLIIQMGGEVVQPGNSIMATYWVYYKRLTKHDQIEKKFVPPKYVKLHWLFITESFFSMGRRDISKYKLSFV